MPGKMARSDPRPSVRITRGAGSGQHLASVLQEGRENANIDAGLGFIWRISARMRAAIAALPHEVPKLAVTAVVSEQDFATVLDRRLKRIEEKGNAIKATPVIDGEKVDARLPPRLPDRRFRRI
jgi:hypothetical protein